MSATGVQPDHRVALWKTLLTAEMNVCYWTWISDRCTRWDKVLKLIIAIAASSTVAAWGLWSQHPEAWKVLSAVSAIAALVHPRFFSSERLKRISGLVGTWKEICINCELLWEKDEYLRSPESWNRFEAIKLREASIDETTLPYNRKLLDKAYEHVLRKRGILNAQ